MKRLVIVIILCLPVTLVSAQTTSKDKKFINEVILGKKQTEEAASKEVLGISATDSLNIPKLKNLYEDSVGVSVLRNLREAMTNNKRGIFYNFRTDSVTHIDSLGKRTVISYSALHKLSSLGRWRAEGILADSLSITGDELKYINTQIDKMHPRVWDKGLLYNADMITTDSLRKIFSSGKNIYDGWDQLKRKGYDRSYSFSIPIYFRNDTYCLFYYGYGCGSLCGYGEVAIYKKVDGKWQHWAKLTSWIS